MNLSLDVQRTGRSVPTPHYDVVVVGAGPYGLSTAAHLLGRGLKIAIFGKPVSFWREQMPRGMLLRSEWWATSLSDPHKLYAMECYLQERGEHPQAPLPVEIFIDYAQWFQEHVVPNVDETYVKIIERKEDEFVVTLVDDRKVQSSRVVLAPGLRHYVYCPPEFNHLPAELVSHTSNHSTFESFAGKRVVVIGGGQSSLETAALAHESGANVQLVTRHPLLWLQGIGSLTENRSLIKRLRHPKAGISYGWLSWGLEHLPYAFQHLPRPTKDWLLRGRGRYGPGGAPWLRPRVEGKILLHESQKIYEAKEVDDGVRLSLSSNTTLKADHVILGTGYRVDIHNLPMVHPTLLTKVQTYQNSPVLNRWFESSVTGLYFVGSSSVSSCGPLYRFVIGTEAAAQRVSHAIALKATYRK